MGALDHKTRRHRRNRLAAEMAVTYHPRRHFRLGQDIGWHWQIDDPNTLYRRRNRLTYTRDFSNAAWTKLGATITADAAASPLGGTTADAIVEDGTTNAHRPSYGSLSVNSGQTYTASCYYYAGTRRYLQLTHGSAGFGSNVAVMFDLQNGVASTVGSAVTAYACTAVAGFAGWYRLSVSGVCTSTITTHAVFFNPSADGAAVTYTGTAAAVAGYITGAQFEEGLLGEYQDVPTTWPQAYLDAVGAQNIYAWKDTAGTDPVTAVGEGIGLLLGREYGGYRGPELLESSVASGTGWSFITFGAAASGNQVTFSARYQNRANATPAVVGSLYEMRVTLRRISGNTALALYHNAATGEFVDNTSITITDTAAEYRAIVRATGTTVSFGIQDRNVSGWGTVEATGFSVREIPGTHLTQATGTAKPTLSARVNLLLNTATMSTQNVTTVAAGYRLRFEGTGTVTLSGTVTAGPLSAGTHNVTATAGTLTLTVSGSVTLADLRTADDAAKLIPAYQRVGATATDHDTDGFPHYAEGDGTDNFWASVATVDGSGINKLSLVTALTKNTDAAIGIVLELTADSNISNGSFFQAAPIAAGAANVGLKARGTVGGPASGYNAATYAAPFTATLGLDIDLSASTKPNVVRPYINGVLDQGEDDGNSVNAGGNFANATLYVLSRAGASSRFNGRFYGSTGRFGPMGDSERNNLTRWWQKRIGTA